MRLKNIIENLDIVKINNFKNYNISSITHISQDVEKDGMFICIKGNNYNGHDYIESAISLGAKCILTEDVNFSHQNVTVIIVENVRVAMSVVAKNFYNRCVDQMKVVGIVGTCGKTTTSSMVEQILTLSGKKVGLIGTNGIFIDKIRQENKFTTPDPLELHYIFYQMKMLGVEIIVMEASAQAIYYKKVYGINFDICVFTNISNEHLDFFGSVEKYARVKMDFFNSKNMKECVVNIDDFFGRELAYKVNIPCVSYGIHEPCNSFAIDINYQLDKTQFTANILDDVFNLDVSFVGEYNVYNLLAALTVCKMLGLEPEDLENAIKSLSDIPGRFNVFEFCGAKIIIDFAHTPDSIEKLLSHIRTYCNGKIIGLFGCVGYSDREKRQDMAKVVSKFSDVAIITSDNPGNTPYDEISKDIISSLSCEYYDIQDRTQAIKFALDKLNERDTLVLIGKGIENFKKIGEKRLPYSEYETLKSLMEKINENRAN